MSPPNNLSFTTYDVRCAFHSLLYFVVLLYKFRNEVGNLYTVCRYGEQAAQATNEGLTAAGHAMGTAWATFKIRKAINPKSVLKPTTLAKSGAKALASDFKGKKSK